MLTHPAHPATRSGVALRFVLAIFIIAGGMIYLMIAATVATATEYVQIADLIAPQGPYAGQEVRTHGKVQPGSLEVDRDGVRIRFRLRDESEAEVAVVFEGTKPDALQETGDAFVTGTYDAGNGVIRAHDLQAKCPSRYESTEGPTLPEDSGSGTNP